MLPCPVSGAGPADATLVCPFHYCSRPAAAVDRRFQFRFRYAGGAAASIPGRAGTVQCSAAQGEYLGTLLCT